MPSEPEPDQYHVSDSTTPVILSAVRTPIGRYLGGLSSFTAPQLGAMVIREAEMHKVPYMAVVGEKEVAAGTVAVRRRGAGKKQEVMPVDAFLAQLLEEIRTRRLD